MRVFRPVTTLAAVAGAFLASETFGQTSCNAGCPADWNQSCSLGTQDIFDFLADYFAGHADFNGQNGTSVQDIFDYLAAYFDGCCPDLDIVSVGLPAFVVPGCGFDAVITVRNAGTFPVPAGGLVSGVLSINTIEGDGDDVSVGNPTLLSSPLAAGEQRPITVSFALPSPMALTTQTLHLYADSTRLVAECNESNNTAVRTIRVQCPDVSIDSLVCAGGLSGTTLPVGMTLRNHGPCNLNVRVDLSMNSTSPSASVTAATYFYSLSPEQTLPVSASIVAAPSDGGDCGAPDNATLTAVVVILNAGCDDNINDNARSIPVPITDPTYDIRLSIHPVTDVCSCGTIVFDVDVWNAGDGHCNQICFGATIEIDSDCTFNTPNPPSIPICVTNIAPNQIKVQRVILNPGCLSCGRTQWLKVVTSQDCHPAGNCDTEAVFVDCPGFCN